MEGGDRLWGWLGQDHDPLHGKPLAESLVLRMAGMKSPRNDEPRPFLHASLRPSRLAGPALEALVALFGTDGATVLPQDRANVSLGQSFPDQLARRAGVVADPVDAVVFPATETEVAALFGLAAKHGFCVQPVGGATNVTSGFSVAPERPRVAVSMRRMSSVIAIHETDLVVEVQAGIKLAELETCLGTRGLTLGHFPQSFHGVTLGGTIAANGSGQRSLGYGRISDMLLSARLITPRGAWSPESRRHSAAGPALGNLVCGSEGLFGLITSATLRVRRIPQVIDDRGWLAPSFSAALEAARALVQNGIGLSMIRISDEAETSFLSQFRLAMKGQTTPSLAERVFLVLKRAPQKGALIIAGFEGDGGLRSDVMISASAVFRKHGAIALGAGPGLSWRKSRYDLPNLREGLFRRGVGVDTFETIAPWSRLAMLKEAATEAFRIAAGTRSTLTCHLSHSYPEGACLYFTGVWAQDESPLGQWRRIKSAVSDAFAEHGGAASHHHGVGSDHAGHVRVDIGEPGLSILRHIKQALDPENILVTGMAAILD